MAITTYLRLDKYLAENGYAGSRERARAMIESGKVSVNGQVITLPSFPMKEDFRLEILEADHPWVSRGGLKLDYALQAFKINPKARIAIDVGASTGGFTDVLIKKGAAKVYCVDTGTDQLHERIRNDQRVTFREQFDARNVDASLFPEMYDLIVCDVSFISLIKALPEVMNLAPAGTDLIALIKPQFEVGPGKVGKGGIVTDPELQKQACADVETWLRDGIKWTIKGFTASPIEGGDGNKEFFVHAVKP